MEDLSGLKVWKSSDFFANAATVNQTFGQVATALIHKLQNGGDLTNRLETRNGLTLPG